MATITSTQNGVTIIGGGLAGLVAAVTCAENDTRVTLYEARSSLGGRARSTDGDFTADFGAHALYRGGAEWFWLEERGLLEPVRRPPLTLDTRFRVDGRLRRIPPSGIARTFFSRRRRAPVEQDFRSWASEAFSERAAEHLARAAGVFTFDYDPGRLSARFVWERLVRTFRIPGIACYVLGGWSRLIERLEHRARELGVEIHTEARVNRLPDSPVIIATELKDARALLGDESLEVASGHAVVLDVGIRSKRTDPEMVSDLDEAGFAERYAYDRSRSPQGAELIQSHLGIRPEESPDDAARRLEQLLDIGFAGWRERTLWHRRLVLEHRTGALDLPGQTWRDRPAVDRGEGVFLVGDMVAAPGLLSEVAHGSAIEAGERAVELLRRARASRATFIQRQSSTAESATNSDLPIRARPEGVAASFARKNQGRTAR